MYMFLKFNFRRIGKSLVNSCQRIIHNIEPIILKYLVHLIKEKPTKTNNYRHELIKQPCEVNCTTGNIYKL